MPFIIVVSFRMAYLRLKRVSLLDAKTHFSKYSRVLTDTDFVYYKTVNIH